jgi:chaperonin GroES
MKIKASQIQPLGDRILVDPDPIGSTESGLIIPENAKEKPQTGTVVASGLGARAQILGDPQAKQDVIEKIGTLAWGLLSHIFQRLAVVPNELKAGDRIFFGSFAGQEIEIDEKRYLIMREADVIGRINEEA